MSATATANHKATEILEPRTARALWLSQTAPDAMSDRERAMLAGLDDPDLVAVRDTIAAGPAAVRRVDDPDLALLLEDVNRAKLTDKQLASRRRLLSGDALAADLFAPVLDGPGNGRWPKRLKHQCQANNESGAVVTIRMKNTTVSPMVTPRWRDNEKRPACPACYYDRVLRQSKQILYEGERHEQPLEWEEIANGAAFKRFTDRVRQKRSRKGIDGAYRAYPQDDGRYIVVAESGLLRAGTDVPTNRAKLFYLVDGWAQTPDDKRISSSGGWGGRYQGTKGDGRVKQAEQEGKPVGPAVQLWTTASAKDVIEALGGEQPKGSGKTALIQVSAEEAYQALAKFTLYERKTNRAGLEAFLEFLGVTDKEQGNQLKDMSLIRDNAPDGTQKEGGDGEKPPQQAGFSAVFGEVGQ